MISIKELIRNEVDRRRQNLVYELMGREEDCAYHRIKGMHDAYVDMLTYIDNSVPKKEPVTDCHEFEPMKERVPVSSSLGTREERKPAEWSEGKIPKDIEKDAVQFCFDKGLNVTPYQAKQIASHYLRIGHNEGYVEGRKNAHIPAKELGLPSSMDYKQEWSEGDQHQKEQVLNALRLELNKWLNHSVRGMKSGNPAYFQGKITLIHDLLGFIHDIDNPKG